MGLFRLKHQANSVPVTFLEGFMKTKKITAIIALIALAVFAFALTSCPDPQIEYVEKDIDTVEIKDGTIWINGEDTGIEAFSLMTANTLLSLEIASRALIPAFNYDNGYYQVLGSLSNNEDSIMVNFTRRYSGQIVVWRLNSGTTSGNITGDSFTVNINEGSNTLAITVNPSNNSASKTYTISIYKQSKTDGEIENEFGNGGYPKVIAGVNIKINEPKSTSSDTKPVITLSYGDITMPADYVRRDNKPDNENKVKGILPISGQITLEGDIEFDPGKWDNFDKNPQAVLNLFSEGQKMIYNNKSKISFIKIDDRTVDFSFNEAWEDKIDASLLANGGILSLDCRFTLPLFINMVQQEVTFHVSSSSNIGTEYYISKDSDTVYVPMIQIFSEQNVTPVPE